MIKVPQNKGIALVAIGAVAIFAALADKWDFAYAIVMALFARMPTDED